MSHDANHELLAQEMKPLTDATLTVRVIKSFPFRTCKNLVLKDLDLTTMTVGGLIERCKQGECAELRAQRGARSEEWAFRLFGLKTRLRVEDSGRAPSSSGRAVEDDLAGRLTAAGLSLCRCERAGTDDQTAELARGRLWKEGMRAQCTPQCLRSCASASCSDVLVSSSWLRSSGLPPSTQEQQRLSFTTHGIQADKQRSRPRSASSCTGNWSWTR